MVRVFACVTQAHNIWLLALAAVICAITGLASFHLLHRARIGRSALWALAGGGVAGAGVWSTHFVAMTAFDAGLPTSFSVVPLATSLGLSLVSQLIAFRLARVATHDWTPVAAGAISGLGIAAMHYLGMTGLEVTAIFVWEQAYVLASLILAAAAGVLAMVCFDRCGDPLRAGAIFVVAVLALHFTGMAAFTLLPIAPIDTAPPGVSTELLGLGIGFIAVILVVSGLVAAYADNYLFDRARMENIRLREEVARRTAELGSLLDVQAGLRKEAEAANAAKSQFLANMSHELRTPLSAIIGYSELVLEECDDPIVEADAERILHAATHLLSMINDVLDMSKIEAGKMTLHLETVDMDALVKTTVETLAPAAGARRDTLQVDYVDLGTVRTDGMKLKQCLLNLLSNAVKFTEGGTVTLSVQREPRADGDWMSFVVRDTGIGMSSAQLASLFQPFVQADSSISRRFGGTGLGLAITKNLIGMLGGDLRVESKPGEGSAFSFAIPVVLQADASPLDVRTVALSA